MMTGTTQHKSFSTRLILLSVLMICCFLMISKRLYDLQIEQGAHYQEQSLKNRLRTVVIPAPRGRIFDRHGLILVDNRPRFDLIATPEDVTNPEELAHQLVPFLSLNHPKIVKRLTQRTSSVPYVPSVIQPDLPLDTVSAIAELLYQLPGVDFRILPVRSYNHADLACHILGYTGSIPAREWKSYEAKGYDKNDEVGKEGIEETYESYLRGKNGGRQIQVDSMGHLDKILGSQGALKGNDIFLTIDLPLQQTLEDCFKDKSGAAVVIDVSSGAIRAITSHPGFDPNAFTTGHREKITAYMTDNKASPLLNRAIAAEFAPGSIFKPIVALAGLEQNFITTESSHFCNGTFKLKNTIFKCWRKWGHGEVNLATSIEQSCNVYYYYLGREMGPAPIVDLSNRFRIGQKTGFPLQGERSGLLPSPEWKKNYYKDPAMQRWHAGDSVNFSIGQGYLLVTPLQMAVYTAGLATGKFIPTPYLLERVTTPDGKLVPTPLPPEAVPLEINPEQLSLVRQGMHQVVHAKTGTGRKALTGDLLLAGKTGTAQKKTAEGEIKNAWFIGFAPFENPQIAIAIIIVDADSGGSNAAPVAKKLLSQWFDIPIDSDETEVAITTAVPEPELTPPIEPESNPMPAVQEGTT